MEGQTVIGIVAAAIALAAMGVSIWQAYEARKTRGIAKVQADTATEALAETQEQTRLAREANTNAWLARDAAEKAASAAEDSVREQQKANELAHKKDVREAAARASAAVAHARKVTSEITGMGGYGIHVSNDAHEPFYKLALEHVQRLDHPTWGWQINKRVSYNPVRREKLDTLGECTFYIDFVNDNGIPQPFDLGGNGAEFTWTICYMDANGQRWKRTQNEDPLPDDGTML